MLVKEFFAVYKNGYLISEHSTLDDAERHAKLYSKDGSRVFVLCSVRSYLGSNDEQASKLDGHTKLVSDCMEDISKHINIAQSMVSLAKDMDYKRKENAKNSNFHDLVNRVEVWAKDRGILGNSTPLNQLSKTFEECEELENALVAQKLNLTDFYTNDVLKNTKEEIEDAIGDILVTLIIQSRMQNLDIVKCLEAAVDIIEKRSGRMVDGIFVKDS